MNKILTIARYTLIGNLRARIFWVLGLFGLLLLGSSGLFSLLGQEQEIRMLLDLGLASIEILGLLTAIFLIANLVLEEIESRTIYLVLTRSISKPAYLLGRYLGTILAVGLGILLMTLFHSGVLAFKGWHWREEGWMYAASVFMSFEKILIVTALALLFSLTTSSSVVALVFTFFFWLLGHFALELKFLAGRMEGGALKEVFKGIYYLIPHFQYLNARDLWLAVGDRFKDFVLQGSLYTAVYSACALVLASWSFRKKEF